VNARLPWRVLWSGPADGYTNMAVDEALMGGVAQRGTPTLRLYGWRPPTVSLGYFQPVEAQVDQGEIARRGWGLVRRPTGGRALLHHEEVTYSVAIAEAALPQGASVMGSYREISRGIECGLRRLGVVAALGETAADPRHRETARDLPTVCFAQTSRCDMVVEGRKVVGSAQVRRDGIILQHGSVPLRLNVHDHLAVMPGRGSGARSAARLAAAAQGIADLLGQPLGFEELGWALAAGFAEAFAVPLEPGELTPAEQARAQELRVSKYATDEWNLRAPGRQEVERAADSSQ